MSLRTRTATTSFLVFLGPKDLLQVSPDDVIEFFESFEDLKHSSRYKRYTGVRAFHRWAYGLLDHEVLPPWKGFKVKKPKKSALQKQDLISPDEFESMLAVCADEQEQSIIYSLYEVGLRASEMFAMNSGSVEPDEHGCILHVPDVPGLKTGPRPVRVLRPWEYLREHLQRHRTPHDPKAPCSTHTQTAPASAVTATRLSGA